jgi:hypothetical protein
MNSIVINIFVGKDSEKDIDEFGKSMIKIVNSAPVREFMNCGGEN